jgi:hypothetical protein
MASRKPPIDGGNCFARFGGAGSSDAFTRRVFSGGQAASGAGELLDDSRAGAAALPPGEPATAAGAESSSGFGFIVLFSCFSFACPCSKFVNSFFIFGQQSESSLFTPATSRRTSSTFALPSAIATRRPATSDSTDENSEPLLWYQVPTPFQMFISGLCISVH